MLYRGSSRVLPAVTLQLLQTRDLIHQLLLLSLPSSCIMLCLLPGHHADLERPPDVRGRDRPAHELPDGHHREGGDVPGLHHAVHDGRERVRALEGVGGRRGDPDAPDLGLLAERVALDLDPGDISTIEDEGSVEEARRALEEFKAGIQV